jgi:hypothetical protein
MDVAPHQIWEFRFNRRAKWRLVRVINVSWEAVELEFLDIPDAAASAKTFKVARTEMANRDCYRFVSGRP